MRGSHVVTFGVTLLAAFLASAPAAAAQRGAGRLYDPATVQSVTGTVVQVDSVASPRGTTAVVRVRLATGTDTVAVHLGPSWYLARQQFRVAAGDHLTVTGSRVTLGGAPVLIAADVANGKHRVRLRDRNGIPAWSRRG